LLLNGMQPVHDKSDLSKEPKLQKYCQSSSSPAAYTSVIPEYEHVVHALPGLVPQAELVDRPVRDALGPDLTLERRVDELKDLGGSGKGRDSTV
jgi:hypothetical protein